LDGQPESLAALLNSDQEQLREIVEQTGQLLAKVVLFRVALHRQPGELELTENRLGHLAESLREAVEDGRAALRAWCDRR
jgi:hypothetical protein